MGDYFLPMPSFWLCGIHTDDEVSHNSARCRVLEATAVDSPNPSLLGSFPVSLPPSLGWGAHPSPWQELLCPGSSALGQSDPTGLDFRFQHGRGVSCPCPLAAAHSCITSTPSSLPGGSGARQLLLLVLVLLGFFALAVFVALFSPDGAWQCSQL